jgi:hypothetical protein
MFGFRRIPLGRRTRLKAVRGLYIRSNDENNPQARGLRLLCTWLSPSQLEQFKAKAHFDVIGCDTGRRYRIHFGTSMNVHELDDAGRLKMGWCFVPEGCLVPGDVMLAQKIALETFESHALSVAVQFRPNERLLRDSCRSFANGHQAGSSKHWIKVKNLKHHAFDRVQQAPFSD